MSRFKVPLVLSGLLLFAVACGSVAPTPAPTSGATLNLAPVSDLSPEIRQLPSEVQDAYRFALANPDVLERIPCYCGCNRVGHRNNLMCYVQPESAVGEVVLDYHTAG